MGVGGPVASSEGSGNPGEGQKRIRGDGRTERNDPGIGQLLEDSGDAVIDGHLRHMADLGFIVACADEVTGLRTDLDPAFPFKNVIGLKDGAHGALLFSTHLAQRRKSLPRTKQASLDLALQTIRKASVSHEASKRASFPEATTVPVKK